MQMDHERIASATTLPWRLGLVWQRRMLDAAQQWWGGQSAPPQVQISNPVAAAWDYFSDGVERQILFWDTLRQRGDDYIEHNQAGKPPLLHFDYVPVLDGRKFARPVNYELVRITPPAGVVVHENERPYVILDPRAGHGPGIGGFKDDSEVGMALREGHPVYFCVFFPEPEPGQTLEDVTLAEAEFLREIIRRHPDSPKPALVGNCQGGWAAMLVAAHAPELVGALVVAGAPISYWAGNDGKNPMRYAGGLLGGAWTALFASDLGGGKFDGAHLVQNFEKLDPANTLVKKSYHLYDQVDTEPPRFLEFERWWGGYYLMNEEEIRWIVENLFVGNNLTEGRAQARGEVYDLRKIRAPIVVFASFGDNITPPQQAINWVLDLYPSTDALKAAGQVVVGLAHQTTGHLGIFVSAKIALREHAQIVELLEAIETLTPGLYQLQITDETVDGKLTHIATLTERSVEELRGLQQYQRNDETPFAAVEAISELTTAAYSTLVRPWLAPWLRNGAAELGRQLHPLRVQHWGWSSLNPLAVINRHAAEQVRQLRTPRQPEWRQWERYGVDQLASTLDVYREVRDAATEALFFSIYAPAALGGVGSADVPDYLRHTQEAPLGIDDAALFKQLGQGDAADGLIRAALLVRKGLPSIRLDRRAIAFEWLRADPVLAELARDDLNARIRQQSLLVWRFPAEARKALPALFADEAGLRGAFEHLSGLAQLIPEATEALANLAQLEAEVLGGVALDTADALRQQASAKVQPVASVSAASTASSIKPAARRQAAQPAASKPAPKAASDKAAVAPQGQKPATKKAAAQPAASQPSNQPAARGSRATKE
ncbi:MAG TPA: DUF3141 domain-containing protein [Chitinolyticbacter sp.]|nr:DUF3141 domain-containing protein [Chitinolyticbacter sp.]